MKRSCDKQVKLLRGCRPPIAGILRLLFAHHVDHFDSTQDHSRGRHRLEPEHRPHSPLDGAVILLDPIIEVGTLPNTDRLELAP